MYGAYAIKMNKKDERHYCIVCRQVATHEIQDLHFCNAHGFFDIARVGENYKQVVDRLVKEGIFSSNAVASFHSIASKIDENKDIKENKINPKHYKGDTVMKFIESFNLGFSLGQTVKYCSRAGKKEGETELEDLRKAKWYLERRIKELEERKINFDIPPTYIINKCKVCGDTNNLMENSLGEFLCVKHVVSPSLSPTNTKENQTNLQRLEGQFIGKWITKAGHRAMVDTQLPDIPFAKIKWEGWIVDSWDGSKGRKVGHKWDKEGKSLEHFDYDLMQKFRGAETRGLDEFEDKAKDSLAEENLARRMEDDF